MLGITGRILALVGLLLLVGENSVGQSSLFKVIVNASNATASLSKEQVSRLFLKKDTSWPDGKTASPVDQPDRSPLRASFSRAIHGRDVAAVKSYWQRMIFSGTAVPPPEKHDDQGVIEYVASTPGGIGYVATGTVLPPDVRSLDVSD